MASLSLGLKLKTRTRSRRINVEVDAGGLERLLAGFGWFGTDFLKSLARAERDYGAGRVRKISSLRQLRSKRRS